MRLNPAQKLAQCVHQRLALQHDWIELSAPAVHDVRHAEYLSVRRTATLTDTSDKTVRRWIALTRGRGC